MLTLILIINTHRFKWKKAIRRHHHNTHKTQLLDRRMSSDDVFLGHDAAVDSFYAHQDTYKDDGPVEIDRIIEEINIEKPTGSVYTYWSSGK